MRGSPPEPHPVCPAWKLMCILSSTTAVHWSASAFDHWVNLAVLEWRFTWTDSGYSGVWVTRCLHLSSRLSYFSLNLFSLTSSLLFSLYSKRWCSVHGPETVRGLSFICLTPPSLSLSLGPDRLPVFFFSPSIRSGTRASSPSQSPSRSLSGFPAPSLPPSFFLPLLLFSLSVSRFTLLFIRRGFSPEWNDPLLFPLVFSCLKRCYSPAKSWGRKEAG